MVGFCRHDLLFVVFVFLVQSELDFDFNAGRKLKTGESFNSFVGRSQDVYESFVGAKLKLFTAVLIFVDGAQDSYDLFLGRERNRTGNASAGALCGFNNLLCCLVYELVIIAFESDPDFFFDCH